MADVNELSTKPLGRLIAQYSIPSVIAMLVGALYNVIDRIFIGGTVGESALAGLTVVFPIMMILFAFVSLISAGGASLLAIRLGEGDKKGADHIFGNTISFGFILNILTLAVIFVNMDGFLALFGANADVVGYASEYLSIILYGFIFQMMAYIFMNFVRTEGQPILAMISMIASTVLNIVLDYLFIVVWGFGVSGAAYATILGQFVGFAILISFYLRGKSKMTFHLKDIIPDFKIVREIVIIGFSSFISILGTSVTMTMINRSLGVYGGTAAITSMGAINSLFAFFLMPIMGITEGIKPIIGYNHGAQLSKRVKKTLLYGILAGSVFSLVVFLVLMFNASTFVGIFLEPNSPTIAMAANGLRIYIAMLPLLSVNLMGIAYFQSTAKGRMSMILGMLRQFILLIPLLMILPRLLGLNGVWISVAASDFLSILIVGIVIFASFRQTQSIEPKTDNTIKTTI